MKLRPVTYKLKGTDSRDIGFLAQEVKLILPEIVYGEEGQMTLSYGQITSVITKAIQEQQKMIKRLQLENDNMKSEIKKLQANNRNISEKYNSLMNALIKKGIISADLEKK